MKEEALDCTLWRTPFGRGCRINVLTHSGPKVLGLIFFKSKTHEEDAYLFLFKISSTGIYTGFCAVVSEKLPKIPLFGPSLIHQLRLLGSQHHPQSGVLLTSFSTWGTENSLAGINLESTGGDKGM